MSQDQKSFIAALENHYDFPTEYTFKFIVPKDKVEDFRSMFERDKLNSKVSKKGNYLSFTLVKTVENSQKVLDVYTEVASIKGVISL